MNNLFRNMRFATGLAFIAMLCVFTSCERDDSSGGTGPGAWEKKAAFAGEARSGAATFVIDGVPYIGTGFDGANRLNDLWQYDAATDTWTKKADLPGAARSGAVGFSANGKGYIGTGYDGTANLRDFWEYDPTSNTWTQVADFPGTARYGAVALAFGNSGYIGGGFDGAYLKDFWVYDPASGVWAEKSSFSGARRVNGYAFAVNGKGYVGGGFNNGILEVGLMEYDPATDTWRNLKNLTRTDRGGSVGEDFPAPRTNAASFVVNNRAYLVGGTYAYPVGGTSAVDDQTYVSVPSNNVALSDVWEFDPASDSWRLITKSSRAAGRESAVGFSVGNIGYVGLGRSGATRFGDIWQFDVTRND